jgi:hypothetical protein
VKVKHIIFLALAALGVLFLWHIYQGHGGLKSMMGSGTAS